MTIGGIVLFVILVIVYLCIGIVIGIFTSGFTKSKLISVVIGGSVAVILSIATFYGMHWYYNNTAAGQRAFKSQQSNFNNGIERIVEVYDVNGKLIKSYDGKFDIDYDDDRIIFDDENGKRHVIYYPTGTVIVDEK